MAAARAVGRVDIRNEAGRVVGYGTASMVVEPARPHQPPRPAHGRCGPALGHRVQLPGRRRRPAPPAPAVPARSRTASTWPTRSIDFAIVAVAADRRRAGRVRVQPAHRRRGQGGGRRVRHHRPAPRRARRSRSRCGRTGWSTCSTRSSTTRPTPSRARRGRPCSTTSGRSSALHHASVAAPTHAELGSIDERGHPGQRPAAGGPRSAPRGPARHRCAAPVRRAVRAIPTLGTSARVRSRRSAATGHRAPVACPRIVEPAAVQSLTPCRDSPRHRSHPDHRCPSRSSCGLGGAPTATAADRGRRRPHLDPASS